MAAPYLQQAPAWFIWLAFLGALCVAVLTSRLLVHLTLCLGRPKDLRRRYGAWAVVTGPTSGIGRSVAMELARRGLNLVLVDLDAANLEEVSGTIRSRHAAVKTMAVVLDLSLVSTPQGDEALRRFRKAVEWLEVGVVVNNAGVAKPGAVFLHEVEDVEAWVRMVRVNLWAVTAVTAAVLPGMVGRGRGAVVNMGSASSEAIPSFPLHTMYAATKRYVAHFSRSLYVEYKGRGIDVQCHVSTLLATSANLAIYRCLFIRNLFFLVEPRDSFSSSCMHGAGPAAVMPPSVAINVTLHMGVARWKHELEKEEE